MTRKTVIAKSGALAGATFCAAAFVLATPTRPQSDDPMRTRLSADRVGDVESGEYSAGDNLDFGLVPYGDKFLLRFTGSPEIFVLYVDHASLGGRVLKYDYGAIALRVSAWGGMTIYTEPEPNGLPATRVGDASAPASLPVSPGDLQNALRDETSHLLYLRQLRIAFSAAAPGLDKDAGARMLAFNALANTATGLDRFSAEDAAHRAVAQKLGAVKIVAGDKAGVQLSGRTLLVHFVTGQGYAGLASSQAIARVLGELLSVPNRN